VSPNRVSSNRVSSNPGARLRPPSRSAHQGGREEEFVGELKITSWNVNSLRSRLERVGAWLERHQPDVLCLQETKCADADFPQGELAELGYQSVFSGQANGLNGVAILARTEPREVLAVLPGRDEDEQRRFLSAEVAGLRVIDLYVPNGQALGSDA